jgi:hypothetical protein
MPTVRGFGNLVTYTGVEIAHNAAQVFLIFDDEDGLLRHAASLRRRREPELHLKSCALAQWFNSEAPAVRRDVGAPSDGDDLIGDGKAETGSALDLGIGAVDLMELLECALELVKRYSRTGVSNTDGKLTNEGSRGDAHLASVGELDGVAYEIERHLCEALLVKVPSSLPRPGVQKTLRHRLPHLGGNATGLHI